MNKKILKYLLFVLALGLSYYFGYFNAQQKLTSSTASSEVSKVKSENKKILADKVPTNTLEVLNYIDEHQRAPDGYVGGRTFRNLENLLPEKNNTTSKKINYREWDVNPKKQGKNRGSERLVTGDDKSAYYTKDHYQSFIKIR